MNKLIAFLSLSLIALSTSGCLGVKDKLKTPGPIAPMQPTVPVESIDQTDPVIEAIPPVQESKRSINGQVVKLLNLIFPSAHAAEVIDVYRFKSSDQYELLGSYPVSEKGEFSITLKPEEVDAYMLHLILREDTMKWGVREKILPGDSDQVITLDAFTAVETRLEHAIMKQTNGQWDNDKKQIQEEDLKALISEIDTNYKNEYEWQDYIKMTTLSSLEKSVDISMAEAILPFIRGEEEIHTAIEKVQKSKKDKKNKPYYTFGECSQKLKDQKIIAPEGREEKIEIWLEATDKTSEKVLGPKAERIYFNKLEGFSNFSNDIFFKMEELAVTNETNFNFRLTLKDKNSQHEEACQYQTNK